MSFIRAIFRGPFLHKDWLVEPLRVLQFRFHHNFHLFSLFEEGESDPFIRHAGGYGNKASTVVTLAKHTEKIGVGVFYSGFSCIPPHIAGSSQGFLSPSPTLVVD